MAHPEPYPGGPRHRDQGNTCPRSSAAAEQASTASHVTASDASHVVVSNGNHVTSAVCEEYR